VDTTIVIPNEKLLAVAQDAGFFESFRVADDILRQGVQGISDIITIPGIINRDFADVKAIMARMGYAVMGTASANGSRRATEAAQKAIASPLLEAGAIDGARGILINITGSASLKLAEVQEACSIIQNAADDDANIIFGAVLDEKMKDAVKITVIATGFREEDRPRRRTESTGFTISSGADDFEPDSSHSMVMESGSSPSGFSSGTASGSASSAAESGLGTTPAPSPSAEVIALDSMRSAIIANFEQADLDVPAFLRKRGDVV